MLLRTVRVGFAVFFLVSLLFLSLFSSMPLGRKRKHSVAEINKKVSAQKKMRKAKLQAEKTQRLRLAVVAGLPF